MTAAVASSGHRRGSLPARIGALIQNMPRRLHERAFWITQSAVIAITAVHMSGEAWSEYTGNSVPSAFHHIPVVLYLGPIIYASLRYGTEGAVLTGLWSAVLTVPNLILWHRAGFEWATELAYVGVVISVGAVSAVPVERERRQREHAEATTRRLALLDEIATLTLTADLAQTLDRTLTRLLDVLDLRGACIATVGADGATVDVLACQPPGHDGSLAVTTGRELSTPTDIGRATQLGDSTFAVPLVADLPGSGAAGRVEGLLAVDVAGDRVLTQDERRVLVGVASHLAIAVASEQLQESERRRLRSYAQQITQAQEDERQRIARELHDEAAQDLVVVRRGLDALAEVSRDTELEMELRRLRDLIGRTLSGVRRFSRDLRPPTLDDLGLSSALEALVEEVQERSGMTTYLRVIGQGRRLRPEIELAVFRIGQAALHNVEHHARADRASVELTFAPEQVCMTVTDDGRGFDPPERLDDLMHAGKLGLIGMRERAQLVGGILSIVSHPGGGTRINLEVPDRSVAG